MKKYSINYNIKIVFWALNPTVLETYNKTAVKIPNLILKEIQNKLVLITILVMVLNRIFNQIKMYFLLTICKYKILQKKIMGSRFFNKIVNFNKR